MTFTSVVLWRTVIGGGKWFSYGTWDGDSVTTGDIDTQLDYVESMVISHIGNGVKTNAPSIDEEFPLDGGIVTIDFDNDTDGTWMAIGKV